MYTGFPFGNYHYDESFGPKLLRAPYFLSIAYFYIVYVEWSVAHVLLRRWENRLSGAWVVLLPVVATLLVVTFDMIVDPFFSTVQGRYVWHDGGSYFGVPFVNFLGWYLCTYSMFQSFALFRRYTQREPSSPEVRPSVLSSPKSWVQVVLLSCTWGAQQVMKGFTVDPSVTVQSLDGKVWKLADLLQTSGIVGMGTMLSVALIAFIIIWDSKREIMGVTPVSSSPIITQ
jgi:putative membrane protein